MSGAARRASAMRAATASTFIGLTARPLYGPMCSLSETCSTPPSSPLDRQQRCLYTVHGDSSEISAFRIDPRSGELAFLNRQSTRGKNPVHLTVDPTNRFVVVANHVTAGEYVSSLAVLALNEDGSLGVLTDHVPLKGKLGPHRLEQPFAKPHQVRYDPSDRFIAVPDKGLDLVVTYTLDATGKLKAIDA